MLLAAALLLLTGQAGQAAPEQELGKPPAVGSLVIIWTSRDPDVARNMVFMYARNARLEGYWDRVRLVVWGPSAQLLANDRQLQGEVAQLKAAGVEFQACRSCAQRYGVAAKLASLGIKVILMGKPLTEMLKSGWTCLTF